MKRYGILYHNYDSEILDYFLNEAFPTEDESNQIVTYLGTTDEATVGDIKKHLNLKDTRINKALKHLDIDGFIAKENYKYSRTAKPWDYDSDRVDKIKKIRNLYGLGKERA